METEYVNDWKFCSPIAVFVSSKLISSREGTIGLIAGMQQFWDIILKEKEFSNIQIIKKTFSFLIKILLKIFMTNISDANS